MDRPPTTQDLVTISRQLGRPARGVVAIARDCPYGYPQVTVNHPLRRDGEGFEVFPTLFWLTCPFLVEEVARLESAGWVKRLEARLREDAELAARYARAHDAYRRERLSLLSPEEERLLRERGAWDSVTTGVAGLRNPLRVKCLHAQLAHFLVRGENPIGELVTGLLPSLHCPPRRVICARFSGKPTG